MKGLMLEEQLESARMVLQPCCRPRHRRLALGLERAETVASPGLSGSKRQELVEWKMQRGCNFLALAD